MTLSCIGLNKICFLLSVTFCAFLLLLIPKFQTTWRHRGYPQPRPPPPFNASCKSEFYHHQADPSSTDHLDSEGTDTAHSVKDETVEKWGDYSLRAGGSSLKLEEQDGSPTSSLNTMLKDHHGPAGDSIKENLELKDIFIAVKTTRKYHKTRLDLLFQTWISQAKRQVRELPHRDRTVIVGAPLSVTAGSRSAIIPLPSMVMLQFHSVYSLPVH